MDCACDNCTRLIVYPELPCLDMPSIDGNGDWVVACNYMGPLYQGKATVILRGFRTDGVSIPRPMWRVIGHPFQLPLLAYALIHDADYAAELMPRAEADARFRDTMLAKVSRLKADAVYAAVRMGGGSVWANHDAVSVQASRNYCKTVDADTYNRLKRAQDIKGEVWSL